MEFPANVGTAVYVLLQATTDRALMEQYGTISNMANMHTEAREDQPLQPNISKESITKILSIH